MARAFVILVAILMLGGALVPADSHAAAPRRGGVLNAMLYDDLPQGFALNETSMITGIWTLMPCYSNLVLFDPKQPVETVDSIVGELAERWSWQDGYRRLVFFLRRGVATRT